MVELEPDVAILVDCFKTGICINVSQRYSGVGFMKLFGYELESLIPENPAAEAVSVLPLPFQSVVCLCVHIEGRRPQDNDDVSVQDNARVSLLLK